LSGVAVTSLYVCTIVMPVIFAQTYGLNVLLIGVCYLPFGAGAMTGSHAGGKVAQYFGKRYGVPEAELLATLIGCFIMIVSILVFAWALYSHLAAILISTCFIGFGLTFHMPGIFSYILVKQSMNAGAVSSVLQFCQFLLSAIGILVGSDLVHRLGANSVFTFLALLLFVSAVPGFYLVWTKVHPLSYIFKEEELVEVSNTV